VLLRAQSPAARAHRSPRERISSEADMANKVITGTKDKQRFEVRKGSTDIREIRCPKCKNVARHVPDGRGGKVCKCLSCGQQFNFLKL
jgi:hypothetical protein